MIPTENEKEKFERAKKRVAEIKGFYTHLTVYLVINALLFLSATGVFRSGIMGIHVPDWSYFTTPFFWGIGLLFHGLYVFQFKSGFFKQWEERKIREFMEKDEEELEKFKDDL